MFREFPGEYVDGANFFRQAGCLVVLVRSALTDTAFTTLQQRVIECVHREGSMGVVLDVSGLDVLDSFAVNTLGVMAKAVTFSNAGIVIVGIRPEMAFAMVRLGLKIPGIATALSVDQGLAILFRLSRCRPNATSRRLLQHG